MPRLRSILLASFALMLLCGYATAQSTTALASQGYYADPEVRVFAGQYWIYPTSSSPETDPHTPADFNPLQRKLREGHVIHPVYLLHTSLDAFSSPDLVHWTKHPRVLDSGWTWRAAAFGISRTTVIRWAA